MRIVIMSLVAMFFFVPMVHANQSFHPSRARLLIHGGLKLREKVELRAHFVPARNLLDKLAPLSYVGVGFKPINWLDIEPAAGWAFGNDEPIVSIRLTPTFGEFFYGWTNVELQLPSKDIYWFAQMECRLLNWFHAGIEGEGWGNYKDKSSWSNGGGLNLLLLFKMVGVDTALHFRKIGEVTNPELVLRIHLFL